MNEFPTAQAWLEQADSQSVRLEENLSFGRADTNDVVLADEKVSRRHAIIHSQNEGEFWLVDLGSHNGTYLNDRRVHHPVCLREGDRMRMGTSVFVFRQPNGPVRSPTAGLSSTQTMTDCRPVQCWLLVADIVGSTQLARNKAPEEIAVLTGRWLLQCKQLVEASGGRMNKYLGDGFLAFWVAADVSAKGMATFVEAMLRMQRTEQPRFRIAVHYGQAIFGGAASMGEESLSGPEVNFVFRMEKLAGSLEVPVLFSEGSSTQLTAFVQTRSKGSHTVAGFEGEFPFFTL